MSYAKYCVLVVTVVPLMPAGIAACSRSRIQSLTPSDKLMLYSDTGDLAVVATDPKTLRAVDSLLQGAPQCQRSWQWNSGDSVARFSAFRTNQETRYEILRMDRVVELGPHPKEACKSVNWRELVKTILSFEPQYLVEGHHVGNNLIDVVCTNINDPESEATDRRLIVIFQNAKEKAALQVMRVSQGDTIRLFTCEGTLVIGLQTANNVTTLCVCDNDSCSAPVVEEKQSAGSTKISKLVSEIIVN